MNDDLFIRREADHQSAREFRTKGRGCLSVLVVALFFGIIAGLATYALGYGLTTAIYAGLGTMGVVFGLYMLTTLLMFGMFMLAALLGIGIALWFGSSRR